MKLFLKSIIVILLASICLLVFIWFKYQHPSKYRLIFDYPFKYDFDTKSGETLDLSNEKIYSISDLLNSADLDDLEYQTMTVKAVANLTEPVCGMPECNSCTEYHPPSEYFLSDTNSLISDDSSFGVSPSVIFLSAYCEDFDSNCRTVCQPLKDGATYLIKGKFVIQKLPFGGSTATIYHLHYQGHQQIKPPKPIIIRKINQIINTVH